MNLRRNRIGLNSYPLFSSQHFGLDEPSWCAHPLCGPPDPGRLRLFEGPFQRGRISNGRGGRIAFPSLVRDEF